MKSKWDTSKILAHEKVGQHNHEMACNSLSPSNFFVPFHASNPLGHLSHVPTPLYKGVGHVTGNGETAVIINPLEVSR